MSAGRLPGQKPSRSRPSAATGRCRAVLRTALLGRWLLTVLGGQLTGRGRAWLPRGSAPGRQFGAHDTQHASHHEGKPVERRLSVDYFWNLTAPTVLDLSSLFTAGFAFEREEFDQHARSEEHTSELQSP